MIRRLRRRYILIAMGSLAVVLLILVAGINLFNYRNNLLKLDSTLAWIVESGGDLPGGGPDGTQPSDGAQTPPDATAVTGLGGRRRFNEDDAFSTRYFIVTQASDGTLSASLDRIATVDEDDACSYAQEVLEKKSVGDTGFLKDYRYEVAEIDGATAVVFLDASRETDSMNSLLLISAAAALGCLVAVFIPVAWLTRKATEPVALSIEKQKRFITDAGHELKTPLTILSANAEVLAMSSGDNEWLQSIRKQIERLRRLVNDLVQLSRMDEGAVPQRARFSLSGAVLDTAAPFRAPAEAKGKSLTLEIAPDVDYTGSETDLRRLVSLLCDNAVKYCDEGGAIGVTLRGGKHPLLAVRNTCKAGHQLELSRLFDRFYRGDQARTQDKSGSFGLGLSVARAIAEAHGGTISAAMEDNDIVFTVQL